MIWIYGFVLISATVIGVYAIFWDNSNQSFWSKECKENQDEKVYFWEKVGLFLYERVRQLLLRLDGGQERDKKEQECYRAVYIGKDAALYRKREQAKIWGYIWVLTSCISGIGMVLCFTTEDNTLLEGNKIERQSFGEGEVDYEIIVSGVGEETEQVTITVGEQQPDEEQMNVVFEAALEEVKQEVLGGNISLEEVRDDLNFFTMTEKGIRLSWESGDELVLTSFGEIVAEDIPEEGILLSVTVYMTYATYEAWYEFYVHILPPIKDTAYYKDELANILQVAVEKNLQNKYVSLPTKLETYDLSYAMKVDDSGLYMVVVGFVIVLLLGISSGKSIEKQYKIRNAQMMDDYSQIVSQLSVLITCGMNLRSAWARIVRDYENCQLFDKTENVKTIKNKKQLIKQNLKKENKKIRYAYEEMKLTYCELERGVPESRAYAAFGRRCSIYSYVKLGNLLEQNIRQGAGGLEEALNRETMEALESKIHEAKRKGEQAETKMLIPMFLMLVIVMAVLMIPAFLSF